MEKVEFSKALAKALGKALKAFGVAESVRANYVGTGSKAHRRQLWVRLTDGGAIDLWIEADRVEIGGVIREGRRAPIFFEGRPAEVIACAVVDSLLGGA